LAVLCGGVEVGDRPVDPGRIEDRQGAAVLGPLIGPHPELAGQAIGAGLVDECHLFLFPIVVGGGKRALPDNVRAQLELLDERRFRNGVVRLRYRVCL
jgi:RibD domain-containing protein